MAEVLIFCPTYRLEPETVQAIFVQRYAGGIDFLFTRDNPYNDGRANVYHNYAKGRRAMLDGGYKWMLTIESDIVPPANALAKLVKEAEAHKAGVAYGHYLFRTMYEQSRQRISNVCLSYGDGARNRGDSISMHLAEYKAAMGKVINCTGSGLGITLIARHVLEAIPFRNDTKAHCDTPFTDDVYRAGYKMIADMSINCGHKMTTGEIIWPLS